MFGPEERHFVRQILSDPQAEFPRAVYADWLEERGDPRGLAMRFGIRRIASQRELFDDLQDRQALAQLLEQQHALDQLHAAESRDTLPNYSGIEWSEFQGGLIEAIRISDVDSFCQHAADIFDRQPVHRFDVSTLEHGERLRALGTSAFACIGALALDGGYYGRELTAILRASTHISRLKHLDLRESELDDASTCELADSDHLSQLTSLNLSNNKLTSRGLRTLCEAEPLQSLERLYLGANRDLSLPGQFSLKSPPLRYLDLHACSQFTANQAARWFERGDLEKLQWLNLSECGQTGKTGEVVFGGACPQLQRVNLLGNTTDRAVLRALSRGAFPHLVELRLELLEHISKEVAGELASAPWIRNLQSLVLWDRNGLDMASSSLFLAPFESLTELTWSAFNEQWWKTQDKAIGLLASNCHLRRLVSLDLSIGLTEKCVDSLCQLKSLRQLTIPFELANYKDRIDSELALCDVSVAPCRGSDYPGK